MYSNREVFPRAPLALVAAEIRFTDSARLRQQATLDAVTIALENLFPFAEPLNQTDLNFGPTMPPQVQQRTGVVLKDAASTTSLTLMSNALTYETTAYTEFGDMLAAVTTACEALAAAGVRPALQRIGVRYINEIRVPSQVGNARDWAPWIDQSLLAHLSVGPEEMPVTATQGVTTYDLGNRRGLNCQYAALNQGSVVAPAYLRREAFAAGPFFVLDFDGYQDFTGDVPTQVDAEVVSTSLAVVRAPAGAAFQRSITDKARALFRGEG